MNFWRLCNQHSRTSVGYVVCFYAENIFEKVSEVDALYKYVNYGASLKHKQWCFVKHVYFLNAIGMAGQIFVMW